MEATLLAAMPMHLADVPDWELFAVWMVVPGDDGRRARTAGRSGGSEFQDRARYVRPRAYRTWAMRWQDMTSGEAYVLATDPSIKVTVLETPDEVRDQARVRVRFETGVSAGRVTDIPSRRIGAAWDRSSTSKTSSAHTRRRRVPAPAPSRPARVGDSVTLAETGELLWMVEAIDETRATATVSTLIFERPDTRTVELDRLQVRVDPARDHPRRRAELPSTRPRTQSPIDPAAEVADRLRPIAPRRELDELMEDVYFTDHCARSYDRLFGAGQSGPAIERLREEVRRKGYLLRDTPARAGEYARVRVNGRFDVVLTRRPTPETSLTVDSL